MRNKGIYTYNFLDKYLKRAKYFECFNCQLVSPKNYIIECQHCICQKCLLRKKYCPICKTQIININGENITAFQFMVTRIILSPYLMKCIFDSCKWTGTFQEFVNNHYAKCEYKNGFRLMKEYFEDFDEEFSFDRDKRCKSELKVVRRSNSFYEEKYKTKYTYNNKIQEKINKILTYKLTEDNTEDVSESKNEENEPDNMQYITLNDDEDDEEDSIEQEKSQYEPKEEKFLSIPDDYNKEEDDLNTNITDNVVILLDDNEEDIEEDNKNNISDNYNNEKSEEEISENKSEKNSENAEGESENQNEINDVIELEDSEDSFKMKLIDEEENNKVEEIVEEKINRILNINFLNKKRKILREEKDFNFYNDRNMENNANNNNFGNYNNFYNFELLKNNISKKRKDIFS